MLDFYAHLWFWLIACLAVGAVTGALVRRPPLRRGPARWLLWMGLAFLAGVCALALGALPGALAIHVESALACFAAFILGASAAALATRGTLAAHEGWALGLAPAALLWGSATFFAQPDYQAQLQSRVSDLAKASGVDPAGLKLVGRDVAAPAAVIADTQLLSRIAQAPGVRRVIASDETPPAAAPDKAPEEKAPPPEPAAAKPEPAPATGPAPDGAVDASACQRALDAVVAEDPIVFRAGRATVNRRAARALDSAAEVIRRCPDVTIELRSDGDGSQSLAARRAQAAEGYLGRVGVAGRRLVAAGCCAREEKEPHSGDIRFTVK